jgi:N-glycosylase/DNA lyase
LKKNVAAKNSKAKNEDILRKLDKYINETDIPILAEFCYLNNIRRQFLYENKLMSDSIKKLIEKKESQLERKALNKEIEKTMAIFSLKQLGWRDIQEMNVGFNPKEIAEEFGKMVSSSGAGVAT